MKFQVSNLFRKKEEPVENNAVETAEAQVAGGSTKGRTSHRADGSCRRGRSDSLSKM